MTNFMDVVYVLLKNKNKIISFIMLEILLSMILFIVLNAKLAFAEENSDSYKKIILIDPGHGGSDGGAKSKSGTNEKEINLSISLKLKNKLQDEGYKVYMTREDDTELKPNKKADLEARCNMKKETKCDAFISIHQNKFQNTKCFGAQAWYSDYKDSERFALCIQNSLKDVIDNGNKRVPKAAKKQYKILRDGYEAPAIILECGFISNYNEEQKLKDDDYQDKIVQGIVNGINEYFGFEI